MSQFHILVPVPPDHLPGVNEVPQIEVLESVVADGLALSPPTNLGEKRVGKITIPPAELVSVDVERDGGSD